MARVETFKQLITTNSWYSIQASRIHISNVPNPKGHLTSIQKATYRDAIYSSNFLSYCENI